jgi:hypothetical protein
MKTYDKASWHIDGGENASEVITRFKEIFVFLAEKEMLNTIGEETQEFGMDDSVSLNSTMVNDDGKAFLDTYYDIVLNQNPYEITDNLQTAYENYLDKKMISV